MDEAKRCYKCRELRELSMYSKDKRWADGLSNYCKPCASAKHKAILDRKRAEA